MGGVALVPCWSGHCCRRIGPPVTPHDWKPAAHGGGLAIVAVSKAAASIEETDTPYWWFALAMILFGSGFLAAQISWTVAFMSSMPNAVVGYSAGNTKATIATRTIGSAHVNCLTRPRGTPRRPCRCGFEWGCGATRWPKTFRRISPTFASTWRSRKSACRIHMTIAVNT